VHVTPPHSFALIRLTSIAYTHSTPPRSIYSHHSLHPGRYLPCTLTFITFTTLFTHVILCQHSLSSVSHFTVTLAFFTGITPFTGITLFTGITIFTFFTLLTHVTLCPLSDTLHSRVPGRYAVIQDWYHSLHSLLSLSSLRLSLSPPFTHVCLADTL
jgi:hypothetical protein